MAQEMRQHKRDKVGSPLMHKPGKNQRWTPGPQVCICSTAEVSMRSDASINDQQLPQHLLAAVTAMTSEPGREEKPSIGDFDGSANPLWALYGKEAKSNDESQIQSLKEDMDGVLIFVRSLFPHTYKSC